MSLDIKLKRGLDIRLQGEADKVYGNTDTPETFAIKPTDFKGVIPKLLVKAGHEVKAGTPLFFTKGDERVKITSPVSGEVVEVVRGLKRKILQVKILADKVMQYEQFDTDTASRDKIVETMLKSGAWAMMTQRPFGVIPDPDAKPKAIHISAFDTAPLAPDYDFIVHQKGEQFQAGLDVLTKLTEGTVHLNISAKSTTSEVFTQAKNVQINKFSGPHPAGNPGIQIHHIDPVNKGETVWCLRPQQVLTLGKLFTEGKLDMSRIVALTGSEVNQPKYYKTMVGANIQNIVDDNVNEGEDKRFISGNVLTGTQIARDGYLGFHDSQITVIPEGNEEEFMGWIAPGFDKFSMSRSFFSWLMPGKKYRLDTNMNGEERALVMTGQYEKVLPMDIYPQHLIKAVMIEDIEMMENLGIYEVDEEDFALCEFVCTSKTEVQKILRKGLDQVKIECA